MRIGFRDFKAYDLFEGGEVVADAKVWQGAKGTVDLRIAEPVTMFMRAQDRRKMKVSVKYEGPVEAPIAEGDNIAYLHITSPGTPETIIPLQAAESVGPMGMFGKMGAALMEIIVGRINEEAAQ